MSKCGNITYIFNALSKRWALHILGSIYDGKKSFNDIKKNIPHISSKILSQRLSELESDGFIFREVLSEKPLRVKYDFTLKGESLKHILLEINDWSFDFTKN